jgi:hypothetical protein
MTQSIRDSIRLWQSFRRNPQFWEWVEDVFSREDLERLVKEATDYDFDDSYDPFGHFTLDQHFDAGESWASLRKWLYSHYGKDIWYWCAEEAHQRTFGTSIDECHKAHGLPDERPHIVHVGKWNLLEGFGRMDMAQYANSPDDFEEFMVRNALKKAAAHILSKPERTDRKGANGEKSR